MEKLLIEKLKNNLRPGQKMIASWEGGEMAISAVPGAGKSHCLAVGAVLAIAKNKLNIQKKLLIVTYTRSAAIGVKSKINQILNQELRGELGPQAASGFVVNTIHGLALNIANRYQELSNLNLENSTIIIPSSTNKIIRDTVENWINNNQSYYQKLITNINLKPNQFQDSYQKLVLNQEVLPNLAYTAIKEAKSSGLLPKDVYNLASKFQDEYSVIGMAAGLYQEYEKLLKINNYIDYEDMVLASLKVLKNQDILKSCQDEFWGVFEDEAQDSSPLQNKLIKLLASNSDDNNLGVNLVRVGDPNQAINSTFTPANPIYFNKFCDDCEQKNSLSTMDQAGRSNIIIIRAANELLTWVNQKHKTFRPQFIQAVADNDPQKNANPVAEGKGLEIYFPDSIYETVKLIGDRVIKLLKNNPEHTAAVLVKENRQGNFIAQQLGYLAEEEGINIYEVGEVERQTKIPEEMLNLLKFIQRPHSSENLKLALEVLANRQLIRLGDLSSIIEPEDFIYPTLLPLPEKNNLAEIRLYCHKLLQARLELSTQDLIGFLGMMLGYEGGELATMQKLSEIINQQISNNNSLTYIISLLEEISITKKFDAVEEENENKYIKPQQLTIITIHKSKGLDWDYVFIPFLQDKMLPKPLFVVGEQKFLGNFTLNEVARTIIRNYIYSQIFADEMINYLLSPQQAWMEAERLKIMEEYRLLYVAMTRAKRLLWMSSAKKSPFSWTSFDWENDSKLEEFPPALFLQMLHQKSNLFN
jgi:DNA helicase-2/ATP-dependent DNA helicase PcrA